MMFSKGDRVTYVPYPGATPEHGTVTSVYDSDWLDMFVRFDGTDWSQFIPADLLIEATS